MCRNKQWLWIKSGRLHYFDWASHHHPLLPDQCSIIRTTRYWEWFFSFFKYIRWFSVHSFERSIIVFVNVFNNEHVNSNGFHWENDMKCMQWQKGHSMSCTWPVWKGSLHRVIGWLKTTSYCSRGSIPRWPWLCLNFCEEDKIPTLNSQNVQSVSHPCKDAKHKSVQGAQTSHTSANQPYRFKMGNTHGHRARGCDFAADHWLNVRHARPWHGSCSRKNKSTNTAGSLFPIWVGFPNTLWIVMRRNSGSYHLQLNFKRDRDASSKYFLSNSALDFMTR